MKPSTTSLVQFATKLFVTTIGFIGTIIFARELGSSTLGIYFLAVAVLSWLEFIGQLGVSSAIRKRISERESPDEFFSAGVILQLSILLLLVGFLFVIHPYLNEYIGADVGLILISILVVKTIFNLIGSGLRGQHRVATASLLDLSSQAIRTTFQIVLISLGFGLLGLLVGYAAGFTLAIVGGVALLSLKYQPARPKIEHFRRLLEFARYSWLGALKTRTSAWTDTIVLGFFVAPDLIGIYEVSWNIATVLALASQSISSALFPTMSELSTKNRDNEVRSLLEQSLIYAGIVAIPGAVGAILIAPDLLHFYGSEFTKGGLILALLSIFAIFSSYEGQLQNGLSALDRPDLAFRSNALFISSNLIANATLVVTFGWIGAAIATMISMLISLGYAFYAVRHVIGASVPYRELGYQGIAAGIMGLVVTSVESMISAYPYYYVLISVGIGVIVYFTVLLSFSSRVRSKVFDLLKELYVSDLLK
ncbi:oligosaccharide flippase family protein [Halobellus rubicundus]|uniref:Oligosaccharide flippase family protein n=1 Tax=Halobellus rubicundus TaxID=2996466 RepID=A0ABD5MEE0_9EURY